MLFCCLETALEMRDNFKWLSERIHRVLKLGNTEASTHLPILVISIEGTETQRDQRWLISCFHTVLLGAYCIQGTAWATLIQKSRQGGTDSQGARYLIRTQPVSNLPRGRITMVRWWDQRVAVNWDTSSSVPLKKRRIERVHHRVVISAV